MRKVELRDRTITDDIITDELKNILTKDFVITIEILKRFVWDRKTPTQLIDSENNNEIKCAFDNQLNCNHGCAAFDIRAQEGLMSMANCRRGNFDIGYIPKKEEKDVD